MYVKAKDSKNMPSKCRKPTGLNYPEGVNAFIDNNTHFNSFYKNTDTEYWVAANRRLEKCIDSIPHFEYELKNYKMLIQKSTVCGKYEDCMWGDNGCGNMCGWVVGCVSVCVGV